MARPEVRPDTRRRTIGEFDKDIARLSGASRDLGTSLPAFARAVSEFLEGSSVTVHFYEIEDDEFTLRGSTNHVPAGGEAPRFNGRKTLPGLAVAEHRVVSLSEERGARAGRLQAEEHVFPLEAGGRTLGTVTVEQVAAERLSPLRLDCARRGILKFAEVLDAAARAEALARRMHRLSSINEFAVVLMSTLVPADVPALATATASMIMGCEGCLLRLRDGSPAGSSVRDAHGLRDPEAAAAIRQLEELASQRVLLSGQPLIVRDVSRADGFEACSPRVRTFVCCPLSDGEATIGTITLFNKNPENAAVPARFDPEDADVFMHLVRYVEKALANAARFAKTRELSGCDELTGLPDRAGFRERLLTEVNRARRFNQRFALVTCEVPALAACNSGPDGGATERVLRLLAYTVRTELREYDTLARIGVHTFCIVLPQLQDHAEGPIARIRAAVDREIARQRVSVGIPDLQARFSNIFFPDDGDSGEALLERLEHPSEPKP